MNPKKAKAVCDFCGNTFQMKKRKYLMARVFKCPKCKREGKNEIHRRK
jgi:predicted RNA-binding Zn-ribbon protein involved in translation (DUF1610 family)